jgi:hypothetical protein
MQEIKMKVLKNQTFGKVVAPETFEEIIDVAQTTIPDTEFFNVRFWRGQSDIAWPVHSSAYRRLASRDQKVSEKAIQQYEKRLLQEASHKGYRFVDGKHLSDFELLARLQHHGAATRLVDFTKNLLVALWFCIATDEDKTGALIGLHCYFVGGTEGTLKVDLYDKEVGDLNKYDHPMIWEPPVVTSRVAAQHAVFLYSDAISARHGSLKFPENENSALIIAVSPQLKAKAKRILQQIFDIRHLTLFPDFDGFSFTNSCKSDPYCNNRW